VRKSQPTKISLRVDLEGEEAERAEYLRKRRGLKAYAELMRQLINEAVDRERAVAQEIAAR
jgi:hypothetical protein